MRKPWLQVKQRSILDGNSCTSLCFAWRQTWCPCSTEHTFAKAPTKKWKVFWIWCTKALEPPHSGWKPELEPPPLPPCPSRKVMINCYTYARVFAHELSRGFFYIALPSKRVRITDKWKITPMAIGQLLRFQY